MIKKVQYIFIILILLGYACKKDTIKTMNNSSLNIVVANPDISSVAVNFSSSPIPWYKNQNFIYYGGNLEYGISSGNAPLTIISSTDTNHVLLQGDLNLKAGAIYSLYLLGTGVKSDTLFRLDSIPYYTTALSGVRFINLSPDSPPLSIYLETDNGLELAFDNLSYKQQSNFKAYDASSSLSGSYNFEIHDKNTDMVLYTYSWNYLSTKCNTIVISGSVDPNSSTPLNVFQVNNY